MPYIFKNCHLQKIPHPTHSLVPFRQVVDSAVLFDLGAATVTDTFAQYMGGLLGLSAAQITVNDLVVAPGAAISTSASAFVPLRVEFTAQPVVNPTTQARI